MGYMLSPPASALTMPPWKTSPTSPPPPLGRYRHYKGGEYEVIGVARHSETLEPLVVYRPLYNASGLWVRPHARFFGEVLVDGQPQRRFALIEAKARGPL
jgi:hypothetical protein